MSLKKILMLEQEAMIILDSSNGGFNGVTKDFWTTDLRGGEVVRRYFKALQGGYIIDDSKNSGGGGGGSGSNKNIYKIYSFSSYPSTRLMLFDSFTVTTHIIGYNLSVDSYSFSPSGDSGDKYTFSPQEATRVISSLFIPEIAKIECFVSNYDTVFPTDRQTVKETMEIESVFFCDNKQNLSKQKIFDNFKISQRIAQATSFYKNKVEGNAPFIKPFLVIIKNIKNELEVFLLLKNLNGGSLIEHSAVCDIGSTISIFGSGVIAYLPDFRESEYHLYGGIGIVNSKNDWAMSAKIVDFDGGEDFKLFTITAPTTYVYYNDVWDQLEHDDFTNNYQNAFRYANGGVHYLTGLRRNYTQLYADSSDLEPRIYKNIRYSYFMPLEWFCGNFDETMRK